MLKNLRIKFGHNSVAPHVRSFLTTRKHIFDSLFTREVVTFSECNGDIVKGVLVYCSDVTEFICILAMLRGQQVSDLVLKLGMDGGETDLYIL